MQNTDSTVLAELVSEVRKTLYFLILHFGRKANGRVGPPPPMLPALA